MAPILQEPTFNALVNSYKPVQNLEFGQVYPATFNIPLEKMVISHKGIDVFEVLWSTEVTMSKDLKKPAIENITHVELRWQTIP